MNENSESSRLIEFRADNISKSYGGIEVVNDVSLSIRSNEIVGLLGPNGAGKTTSFYMMVGFVAADSGSISLNDEEITTLPMHIRAGKGIGYLPQGNSTFQKLTVLENILITLEMVMSSSIARRDKAEELLEEFHINHLSDKVAITLSGGERRRLEIARTLATNPSFILLDEPFAGIDPISVKDAQNIISNLKERNVGILLTDHSALETLSICDRAYILHKGKVIEEGEPKKILKSEKARNIYFGDHFSLK
ncbi:MAG: LPS export ABC transporter ATP-binding protein [Nitrospinota bacterium]